MTSSKSKTKPSVIALDAGAISTTHLRSLLTRISKASLSLDVETAPDKAAKVSALMMSLVKSIRETENYNRSLKEESETVTYSGTLDERLKGFAPSAQELAKMRAELKERLQILGPRLLEDDDS